MFRARVRVNRILVKTKGGKQLNIKDNIFLREEGLSETEGGFFL